MKILNSIFLILVGVVIAIPICDRRVDIETIRQAWFAISIITIILAAINISYGLGKDSATEEIQEKAVLNGIAEYYLDEKGDKQFIFKEIKK